MDFEGASLRRLKVAWLLPVSQPSASLPLCTLAVASLVAFWICGSQMAHAQVASAAPGTAGNSMFEWALLIVRAIQRTYDPSWFPAPLACVLPRYTSATKQAGRLDNERSGPSEARERPEIAGVATMHTLVRELELLSSLRQNGELSETEFEVLKARAIASLKAA